MERKTNLESLQDTPPWEWPGNAGELFLEILTDPGAGAKDRATAADLAGDVTVIDDPLCDALMQIAGNGAEPDELRATAVISFGAALEQADLFGFEDPEDVPISEETFERILVTLHDLYMDQRVPVLVRRRALEASVRAPQDWHPEAIAQAYSSGDRDWMLTAVFAMRWIRGFDDLILQALQTADPEIHLEAVQAAGVQELKPALGHIVSLIEDAATPKPLLLVAIEAVPGIAPSEAGEILTDLLDSDDEDIAEAAEEAIDSATQRETAEFDLDDPEDEEDQEEQAPGWRN